MSNHVVSTLEVAKHRGWNTTFMTGFLNTAQKELCFFYLVKEKHGVRMASGMEHKNVQRGVRILFFLSFLSLFLFLSRPSNTDQTTAQFTQGTIIADRDHRQLQT